MFPILYAFHGFFVALPTMQYFEVGDEEEEIGGDKDTNEVTKEENLTDEMNLEEDEAPKDPCRVYDKEDAHPSPHESWLPTGHC
ncbi:hypothetical protein RHMOL_Rhmol10G0250100 [Rhododendron molle]|uniref:Uncharacterized protein n=1 Tax=Rhododendron molle TaxID=49168 RepID=A0ACC0M702_RHOML|nr:hypothetical protein RHMOL_Rhmol10G0250100 [Rhododendron molle]